jgi:hypothetical protein
VVELVVLQPSAVALPSAALIAKTPSEIKYFHGSRYTNY